MANIGEQLLQPENGWKRIEDSELSTKANYESSYWKTYSSSSYSGNTAIKCSSSQKEFSFYAKTSKFRLISYYDTNRTTDAKIIINDNEYTLSLNNGSKKEKVLAFEILDLDYDCHKITFVSGTDQIERFILDAIDIDENGDIFSEEDMLPQNFPVRVADDTIKSEENVANYTATLVNGERQLLLLNNGDMYLSDGKGSHIKMNETSKDLHNNLDVLDLLSTDGKDLFFNGKNIQKVELQDGQYGYSATLLNVTSNNIYTLNIKSGSTSCEQIVQAWEFEEGSNDINTILKTFNNIEKNNFFYNSENIEFTDNSCKIKDEFILENELNNSLGLYETKINKNNFVELVNLISEVSE